MQNLISRISFSLAVLFVTPTAGQAPAGDPRVLTVQMGKSVIIDSPVIIQRVSVASGSIAEAVVITPKEVMVNGLAAGETSLLIWQEGGNRLVFDLRVLKAPARLDAIRRELDLELKGSVTIALEGDDVFLRGTVDDMVAADRAVAIASTLGKPVNLLYVRVPEVEAQILLKVRFADVDRAAGSELGANLFSLGGLNTIGSTSTQAFSPPQPQVQGGTTEFRFTDALNVFLLRPDLNLGATIKALESKRLLQIMAEPNVLTLNGKAASFLAGGEFPFPTLQGGGGGLGAVTIQFREFGVRINFLPRITARGTIRLQVTPEVSALDFANGLTFQGFTIPALNTRRVQTEVELSEGQSFAIGGLLDNRMTETISKVPGLGDIPLLGKLFQSRSQSRNHSELLVIVTPEIVRPIPRDQPLPELTMEKQFMKGGAEVMPRHPGLAKTGPVPVTATNLSVPVESLRPQDKAEAPAQQPIQLMMPGFGTPAPSPAVARRP